MAVFETWLKNDLKKPVSVKQLSGNLFSADNGGNLIGVEVMDEGSPASLSGSVYGYVIRADGATVVVEGTLSENKASITLPTSCYVVVGQISIVIKVGTTTVGACVGYVYRSTTDTIVDPGSVVPSLAELLAKIADCEAATTAANNAATNANTKAGLANDAATLANTKAGLANTAAENADGKATLANNAAAKIDNMTATASGLPAGASPTVSVTEDETDHHKIVAFGIPKGDRGATGATPNIAIGTVTTLPPNQSAYVQRDQSSTSEEPVFNFGIPRGMSGNDDIDDTAGIGDTDKVWSANKVASEIKNFMDALEKIGLTVVDGQLFIQPVESI